MLLVRDYLAAWLHHVGLIRSLARRHHGHGNLAAGLLLVVDCLDRHRLDRNGLEHHHAWLLQHVVLLQVGLGILHSVVVVAIVVAGVALARVLEILWLDEGNVEEETDGNGDGHKPWMIEIHADIEF